MTMPELMQFVGVMTTAIGFLLSCVFVFPPIAKAVARRIEGRTTSPELLDEVDELRREVAELPAVHAELAELRERLEFTERLLAQRDPVRLPGELH